MPAVTFTQTNLVSDIPGMAKTTDPNLVNPWGMTVGTNSGLWVSDNGTGKATTYDGTGQPIPATRYGAFPGHRCRCLTFCSPHHAKSFG